MRGQRKGIIGVGNLLLGDEGVGPHCISILLRQNVPDDILLFDGGTMGYGLMDVISALDALVIVDCVNGGSVPGTIYIFDAADINTVRDNYNTSVHQVGICEILDTARLIYKAPRTTIIGVEPQKLDIGMTLSGPVSRQLDTVAKLALKEIAAN